MRKICSDNRDHLCMHSIAALLTAAGVNLTGWQLYSANGVSADGTIIVGNGSLGPWLARVVQTAPSTPSSTPVAGSVVQTAPSTPSSTPVAGLTTPASLQNSALELGNGRQSLLV